MKSFRQLLKDAWKSNKNKKLDLILENQERHDKNMSKLTDALTAINATQTKAFGEIGTKIQSLVDHIKTLEDALANRDLTTEEQTALDNVVAGAKALDDIVPDAPPA